MASPGEGPAWVAEVGWVPVQGWRWVDASVATTEGAEPVSARLIAGLDQMLEQLDKPLDLSDLEGKSEAYRAAVKAHRVKAREWGRTRLERVLEEARRAHPWDWRGPWLVPVGDEGKTVRWRRGDVLADFLHLEQVRRTMPGPLAGSDTPLLAAILAFAGKWGWLGRPVNLVPVGGGRVIPGEPLRAWLSELSLLSGLVAVLDACDRAERAAWLSGSRGTQVRDELVKAVLDAGRRLGWVFVTVRSAQRRDLAIRGARVSDVVRQARAKVRAALLPGLSGQFSPFLEEQGRGVVERFVPVTLAASLELAVARRTVGSDADWRVCPVCESQFVPKRRDQVYCSRRCFDRHRQQVSPRPAGRKRPKAAQNQRRTEGKA